MFDSLSMYLKELQLVPPLKGGHPAGILSIHLLTFLLNAL